MVERAAGWTVGIAAAVLAMSAARGQTGTLELKRLDVTPTTAELAALRDTFPQYFYIRSGTDRLLRAPGGVPDFAKVITKEPAKYRSKTPFRGVARLGSQYFGFVLDTSRKPGEPGPEAAAAEAERPGLRGPSEPGPEPVHYDRLLFDLNHNGDLTDDRAISATPDDRVLSSRNYARYSFPRVDVTIDSGGVPMEYGFFFSVYSYATSDYWYASASLNAAVYRDGHVTLDGRKRRIVLVDFNSNGRFDDQATVGGARTSQGVMAYVSPGDMVYIDPDSGGGGMGYSSDVTVNPVQQYLGKLIYVDGKLYEMEVTASGDSITLAAAAGPVGYVKNPNRGYRAVVFNDQHVLKIMGDDSGRSVLPVGSWQLASYTIDRTGVSEAGGAEAGNTSLLQVLAGALTASRSGLRPTRVCARAPGDYPAVTVREGQTVELPFGPPYRPVVTAGRLANGTVSLSMSLVGSAGESCTNLTVDGRRPPAPQFTITAPDGTEVHAGKFEYG